MSGTEIVVAGERVRVVGTVSMDALAVVLGRGSRRGPGDTDRRRRPDRGARAVSGTIPYEIACGINRAPERTRRAVLDG